MTAVPYPPASPHPAAYVPPGCPAHDRAVRLDGPEHENDPMGLYARLRAEYGEVAPVLVEDDLPAWLVLGYRENKEVLCAPARFSRDSRRWTPFRADQVRADYPLRPVLQWQPLCVFADGAEHERLRGAITEGLDRFRSRGRNVRRLVERFANLLIDDFSADGQADLISQFAARLPLLVATRLFGMRDEHGPDLVAACRDLMQGTKTSGVSNEFLIQAMRRLVTDKRRTPGEDLASWLIAHPARLTDEEIAEHLRFTLLAANENPIILLGNVLHMILTDQRFRASLTGMQMTIPDAVEQLLWDQPPLSVLPARWATADTDLAGWQIRQGDMVLLGLAAGNADPAIRPDLSVPMHGNRSHLAFSLGPHQCPGQDLGRLITETAVDTLLTRLPDLRLDSGQGEARRVSSWMYRQLEALPVVFEPRRPVPRQVGAISRPPFPPAVAAQTEAAGPPEPETGWRARLRRWQWRWRKRSGR